MNEQQRKPGCYWMKRYPDPQRLIGTKDIAQYYNDPIYGWAWHFIGLPWSRHYIYDGDLSIVSIGPYIEDAEWEDK